MRRLGIPGVREHACFLKEITDAQNIRKKVMDCIETAMFKDQTQEEKKRLLHMVGKYSGLIHFCVTLGSC